MRSICVYCGSKQGDDPVFSEAAHRFGTALAENNLRLVYGGGDFGLMGTVAQACLGAGGKTLGIIPKHIVTNQKANVTIGDVIVTDTMHERKKVMFMNADAIVALPGGIGTMDELIEVISWRQLGLHKKPVVIMNVADYWSPLLAMLDNSIVRDFTDPYINSFYRVTQTAAETIDLIKR